VKNKCIRGKQRPVALFFEWAEYLEELIKSSTAAVKKTSFYYKDFNYNNNNFWMMKKAGDPNNKEDCKIF
jgi:hypothetical protein